jgi:hypothetical protein
MPIQSHFPQAAYFSHLLFLFGTVIKYDLFHIHKDRSQSGSLLRTDIRVFLHVKIGQHVVPSVTTSPEHKYHQATFLLCCGNLSDKLQQPPRRVVLRFQVSLFSLFSFLHQPSCIWSGNVSIVWRPNRKYFPTEPPPTATSTEQGTHPRAFNHKNVPPLVSI